MTPSQFSFLTLNRPPVQPLHITAIRGTRVLKNMLLPFFFVFGVQRCSRTPYTRAYRIRATLVLRATGVAKYDAPRYYVMHVIAPRVSRVAYGTNKE